MCIKLFIETSCNNKRDHTETTVTIELLKGQMAGLYKGDIDQVQ